MRLPDWPARLNAALRPHRGAAFEYGRHDCAILAADAVKAVTGSDPAAAWRGRYTTKAGGLRHMRRAGHADQIGLAAALFAEIHPSAAGAGDLAVVEGPWGPVLAVVTGPAVAVFAPAGLAFLPLTEARRAFKVD